MLFFRHSVLLNVHWIFRILHIPSPTILFALIGCPRYLLVLLHYIVWSVGFLVLFVGVLVLLHLIDLNRFHIVTRVRSWLDNSSVSKICRIGVCFICLMLEWLVTNWLVKLRTCFCLFVVHHKPLVIWSIADLLNFDVSTSSMHHLLMFIVIVFMELWKDVAGTFGIVIMNQFLIRPKIRTSIFYVIIEYRIVS